MDAIETTSLDEINFNGSHAAGGFTEPMPLELDADGWTEEPYSPAEIDEMYAIYCRERAAESHAADLATSHDESLMSFYTRVQVL